MTIIDHLDRHFSNPPLRPSDPAELERMYRWLKLWDETQISLKTLSHNTILKGRAAGMRAQMGKLEALVKNGELVEFMRELTSANGLSKARLERATGSIERVLGELDGPWQDIHGSPATPSRSPTSPRASISIASSALNFQWKDTRRCARGTGASRRARVSSGWCSITRPSFRKSMEVPTTALA